MASSFPLACYRLLRSASGVKLVKPWRMVCSFRNGGGQNEFPTASKTCLCVNTRQYSCMKPYAVAATQGVCPHNQVRWKSKKGKSKAKEELEEVDEEDEEEADVDEDAQGDNEISSYVSSTRIDSILKAGILLSKTKAAESFYTGNIRVNGSKPHKKGMQVDVGDEVDYIVGFVPENPSLMTVHRITLLKVLNDKLTDKGRFKVVLRRQRNLVIEKYDDYEES